MDQINRVKQVNDPHSVIDHEPDHANNNGDEENNIKQAESQSKMSSKKKDTAGKKGASGKGEASKIKDVVP